jgi:ribonuclease E
MHNLIARTRPDVALYVLNQKRAHLRSLEERFAITITVTADETIRAPQTFVIDRGELVHTLEAAKALAERAQTSAVPLEEEDDLEDFSVVEGEEETEAEIAAPAPEHSEGGSRRRRRRRRRGGRNDDHFDGQTHGSAQGAPHGHAPERVEHIPVTESGGEFPDQSDASPMIEPPGDFVPESIEAASPRESYRPETENDGEPRRDDRRRRRGRRGGRRNRPRNGESGYSGGEQWSEQAQPDIAPPEPLNDSPSSEPDLTHVTHAVADLDAPPAERAAPTELAQPPAEQSEPARRRSTVREPAPPAGNDVSLANVPPSSGSAQPPPPAEPVITETNEAAEGERPRRTGWWSRRFAGG